MPLTTCIPGLRSSHSQSPQRIPRASGPFHAGFHWGLMVWRMHLATKSLEAVKPVSRAGKRMILLAIPQPQTEIWHSKRKTKCPGERPICSLCVRMKQHCVYLPRNHSKPPTRVNKASRLAHASSSRRFQKSHGSANRNSSSARIPNIESQIKDIYAILKYKLPFRAKWVQLC